MIFDRNNGTNKDNVINLKGFMVGNAVLDNDHDTNGMVDYARTRAIMDCLFAAAIFKIPSKTCAVA